MLLLLSRCGLLPSMRCYHHHRSRCCGCLMLLLLLLVQAPAPTSTITITSTIIKLLLPLPPAPTSTEAVFIFLKTLTHFCQMFENNKRRHFEKVAMVTHACLPRYAPRHEPSINAVTGRAAFILFGGRTLSSAGCITS